MRDSTKKLSKDLLKNHEWIFSEINEKSPSDTFLETHLAILLENLHKNFREILPKNPEISLRNP